MFPPKKRLTFVVLFLGFAFAGSAQDNGANPSVRPSSPAESTSRSSAGSAPASTEKNAGSGEKKASQRPAPVQNVSTQEPNQLPSWVLYGIGKRSVETMRFGEAIVSFRTAIDRRGIYPEAEMELGKVVGLNGDPTIAEAQLEKALDEAGVLGIPEARYEILYALAQVRKSQSRPYEREKSEQALETYREILSEDRVYRQAELDGGLEGYYNAFLLPMSKVTFKTADGPSLTENLVGLNRILYLYRNSLGFSLRAHEEIAALYYENKAYKQAVVHSLFALSGIFSRVLDEMTTLHPDYVFTDLKELFRDERSPYFIGRPQGVERTSSPGGPNPSWFVKYRPIWEYLESVKTDRTLGILAQSLEKLDRLQSVPATGRRSFKEASKEIRDWLSTLFPTSPWTVNRENRRG